MVMVGKISHVDHKNARYRVQSGNIVSDWIPDTQARAGKTPLFRWLFLVRMSKQQRVRIYYKESKKF